MMLELHWCGVVVVVVAVVAVVVVVVVVVVGVGGVASNGDGNKNSTRRRRRSSSGEGEMVALISLPPLISFFRLTVLIVMKMRLWRWQTNHVVQVLDEHFHRYYRNEEKSSRSPNIWPVS